MILRISAAVEADLRALILHGIGQGLADPVGFVDRLQARLSVLSEHRAAGRPGRIAGTRELVLTGTPYIAVYTIEDSAVCVRRILHGAQQWP